MQGDPAQDRASECTKHMSHQIHTTAHFPDVEVTCLEIAYLVPALSGRTQF